MVSRPSSRCATLAAPVAALAAALTGMAGLTAGDSPTSASVASTYEAQVRPLLDTYCAKCHGAEKQKGELNFSNYATAAQAMATRKLWKSVNTKLADKDMPPEEEPKQPSAAEQQLITGWIASLKALDHPDPGRTTLHRLNRAEYKATIHDLIGLDFEVGEDFPKDDVSDGFDNIAETLSLSPFLMEKYLLAADTIMDRALLADTVVLRCGAGELDADSAGASDPGKPGGKQRLFTTSGRITRTVQLPVSGAYTLATHVGADQGKGATRVAILVDGHSVADEAVAAPTTAPGVITCTAPLAAGEHRLEIAVTMPAPEAVDAKASVAEPISEQPHRRAAIVENVELLAPQAASPSPLARNLLVALPGPGMDKRAAAMAIATRFASRAYRRPASPEQLKLPLAIFDLADRQGRSFVRAVKEMLKTVLVAPEFLFRIEQDRPGDQFGNYQIDDYDLASRLSYFLWSSLPDDELLGLAAGGTLHEPGALRAQVQRMIADPKAQRFIDSFAGQWLLLRNVTELTGRVGDKPRKEHKGGGLTPELRQAMFAEGTGLFGYILRQGRPIGEFIDPGYTFLNEPLARYYGIPDVVGDEMRLVQLPDRLRGGILTLGALLVVNSHPERTSPTRRGRWVLEEVLGKPPPPPPPDIPQLQFVRAANPKATDREILEIHRAKPACTSCHKVMDPIGFGLENFDNQARWRDKIKDDPIDARGELPGKRVFNGPAELKHLIAEHTDELACVLAQRVLTYALGRALQYYDDDTIDAIVAKTASSGYRFDTIVVETALSFPFNHRRSAR